MSDKSNNQGRAYEFVCLLSLGEEIGKFRPVNIVQNSSYLAAEYAWNTLSPEMKNIYKVSSYAAVIQIFELEPRIMEKGGDVLELRIQSDTKGKEGDVRDILIVRHNIQWEIGLSLKHNHFAVKHSRLSQKLDFGAKWYGIPCSQKYWEDVRPVFTYLVQEKNKNTLFDNLPDKENDVYIPLLQAFIAEINLQNQIHPDIPSRLVEYLLGKHDFIRLLVLTNSGQRKSNLTICMVLLIEMAHIEKHLWRYLLHHCLPALLVWILSLIKRIRLSFIWMEVGNSLFAYTMQRRKLSQV